MFEEIVSIDPMDGETPAQVLVSRFQTTGSNSTAPCRIWRLVEIT